MPQWFVPSRKIFSALLLIGFVAIGVQPAQAQNAQLEPVPVNETTAELQPTFQNEHWQLAAVDPSKGYRDVDDDAEPTPLTTEDNLVVTLGKDNEFTVPDSETYTELDAEPEDLLWALEPASSGARPALSLGANAPAAQASINGPVQFAITGVKGPGTLSVLRDDASLEDANIIWDSRKAMPQSSAVPLGTTLDPTWVFNAPGTYLVQFTATASLLDGSEFTESRLVRFIVGTDEDPAQSMKRIWKGPNPISHFTPGAAYADANIATPLTIGLLVGAFILLAVALIFVINVLIRRTKASNSVN